MSDIAKVPSGGGPDGTRKCQSRAAIDGRENKLNGRDPQANFAPEPGLNAPDWGWVQEHPEFALDNPELFIWTHHDDGTVACRPAPDPADIDDEEGSP